METKPSIYTMEFWAHIALQVFFVLNTAHVWEYMPPRWSGLIQAVMFAAWTLSRGIAKSGVGADAAVAANYRLIPRKSDGVRRG